MHYRDIARALGFYLWVMLIPLLFPTCIAIYTDWIAPEAFPQPHSAFAFLITMGITALLGLFFWFLGLKSHQHLFRREGLLLVLIVYFLTPAIAALPFLLNGTLKNPLDAYFETVSGFTTTGASVFEAKEYNPITGSEVPITFSFCVDTDVEYSYFGTIKPVLAPDGETKLTGIDAVSKSLIFWRSFTQCLGGGGIVVLFVAILPALGVGGKILYQTEVTGPTKESIFPRVKETASMLWKVYLGLILLETLLLYLTNPVMPLWDALNLSFTTLSTGGFVPTSGGIPQYKSLLTNWIIVLFMILGSLNFTLYFFCMRGKFFKLNDPELKLFLTIIGIAALLSAWQLDGVMRDGLSQIDTERFSWWTAFSFGTFQVISAQTSTGFATSNYDVWPFATQALMLTLFFVGGMAGSTAGGIKIVRELTFFKILINKIESIFRPDTIREFRIGSSIIGMGTATTVLCFLMIVTGLTILSTYVFILDGVDPETSLATVGCMINNVGMSFRAAGPTHSFAFLPPISKILSILLMIAGRLEFFALLIAFVPAFWRKS